MLRLELPLLSVGLAIIAGCASTPTPPVAKAADGTQVASAAPNERKQICVREQPIGSAIPVTICHYEENEVEKAMNLDAFRNKVNAGTRSTVPGSGS